MNWAGFYLICFAVGFAFSLISFVAGATRWHAHLPNFHLGGHLAHGSGVAGRGGVKAGHMSPFNFMTFAAFLAWFGGTGYLLTRYSSVWVVLGLGIAGLSGLAGAVMVFFFLTRVLTSEEENLDPADFDMVGVLGRVSSTIRAGGTGELIYSQAGTRRSCGARGEDGRAVPNGTEVVVTRYEKGLAYVRLWSELAGEEETRDAPHAGHVADEKEGAR